VTLILLAKERSQMVSSLLRIEYRVGYPRHSESFRDVKRGRTVQGMKARYLCGGLGLAVAGYAVYAACAWLRYGRPRPADPRERDVLLDQFLPDYEVAERHHVRVRASAAATLSAASQLDLRGSSLVRAIFDARARILGAQTTTRQTQGLLAEVQALGWRILAEVPGREIVVGAITQPWKADVVFRCPAPEAFRADRRPDHVKIVWTLRADPIGPSASIFRSETRVATTDARARRRFRRYWAVFSAGIILIRRVMVGEVKRAAERRVRADVHSTAVQSSVY
jgi:hypothetical protein